MSLKDQINSDIKAAMLAKDKESLASLRAIKSAIMLAETEKGGGDDLSAEKEVAILQKLFKQRKEAAELYQQQNRSDLAKDELDQAAVIEKYLPAMMSEEEVQAAVDGAIAKTGAAGPQDMGKVMGMLMGQLKGKADGALISKLVKDTLNK